MQPKRPIGMTILLVLSFINACFQIFGNTVVFFSLPMMKEMYLSGELETMLTPFKSFLDESSKEVFDAEMAFRLSIQPVYHLITSLLYIGSLVGVIKMFKLQRIGFHVYSIAQMLILIVSVIFIYSKHSNAGFFNDFLTTIFLILIYHLYLKRIEFLGQQPKQNDDENTQGE